MALSNFVSRHLSSYRRDSFFPSDIRESMLLIYLRRGSMSLLGNIEARSKAMELIEAGRRKTFRFNFSKSVELIDNNSITCGTRRINSARSWQRTIDFISSRTFEKPQLGMSKRYRTHKSLALTFWIIFMLFRYLWLSSRDGSIVSLFAIKHETCKQRIHLADFWFQMNSAGVLWERCFSNREAKAAREIISKSLSFQVHGHLEIRLLHRWHFKVHNRQRSMEKHCAILRR